MIIFHIYLPHGIFQTTLSLGIISRFVLSLGIPIRCVSWLFAKYSLCHLADGEAEAQGSGYLSMVTQLRFSEHAVFSLCIILNLITYKIITCLRTILPMRL